MGCAHPSGLRAKDAAADSAEATNRQSRYGRPQAPGTAKLHRGQVETQDATDKSTDTVAQQHENGAPIMTRRGSGVRHDVRGFRGRMKWDLDPLITAAVFTGFLSLVWVFAMDIQTASRALWTACGHLKDRMRPTSLPRPQSDPSLIYSEVQEDASRPGTPEGRDSWSLVDSGRPDIDSSTVEDAGHFTEAEFLRRFGSAGGAEPSEQPAEHLTDVVQPTLVAPGTHSPELSEASVLLEERDLRALAAAVPIRHRWRRWHLLYSTGRDGISLQTLYRQVGKTGPSVLVVRDRSNRIFGCFCSEPWKVATRYYGTGEGFVFQLQAGLRVWPWYQKRMALGRNDFFQYSTPDCLAVGGAPAYALKLDGDLVFGRSGNSETFGNSPLASSEEFEIGRVELWALV